MKTLISKLSTKLIIRVQVVQKHVILIFTKEHFADKALKAMYEVLKMGRLYKLSVNIQLELFE